MNTRTLLDTPVPELPVVDVERAQQHYRDVLGFEVNWLYPDKSIGAVSRNDFAIFFRKSTATVRAGRALDIRARSRRHVP